jgi:hypothetical protein
LLCGVQLILQDVATFEALSRKAEATASAQPSEKQPSGTLIDVPQPSYVLGSDMPSLKSADNESSVGSGTPLKGRRGHGSSRGWGKKGLVYDKIYCPHHKSQIGILV